MFTGLATLPGFCREAEDLHLHTAALQSARQNIGAGGSHSDWPAAHGARIVDEQCYHRIAELGVAFLFERQGLHGVNDQAHEARRIEVALFQIKVPRPVLLRHQAALQTICETADRALQV